MSLFFYNHRIDSQIEKFNKYNIKVFYAIATRVYTHNTLILCVIPHMW
jgi:hypothetical protein